MNCNRPVILNGDAFGCGQCVPCRVNARRVWTFRIMLESVQYGDNTFCTLTYRDEALPENMSVSPRELALFVKRLRKNTNAKIRYFGVGEYGDQSGRPHYHLALFGYPNCRKGRTNENRAGYCCSACAEIKKAWGLGRVQLDELTQRSAQYVAGYVTKKMTSDDDPRLEGRLPEFARMSRRPGIGIGMMWDVASELMMTKADEKMIDVPLSLMVGKKHWPLGRYLRRKLRAYLGRDESTPQEVQDARQEELRPLRESAFAASESLQSKILEASLGRRIQIEANSRRNRKRSSI